MPNYGGDRLLHVNSIAQSPEDGELLMLRFAQDWVDQDRLRPWVRRRTHYLALGKMGMLPSTPRNLARGFPSAQRALSR